MTYIRPISFAITIILITLWSAIHPYDPTIWWLEALPGLVGVLALLLTFHRWPLTPVTNLCILIHFAILLVGAHYTYANVPLFDWLGETFNWGRNNYDKVGHFAQGFVPAIISREILIRNQIINRKPGWLPFLICCICLAISAFYELIEWWVAVAMKSVEDDFLGTQGYVWDTQSDMLCALIGAITMLLTLSYIQDRQLTTLQTSKTK